MNKEKAKYFNAGLEECTEVITQDNKENEKCECNVYNLKLVTEVVLLC